MPKNKIEKEKHTFLYSMDKIHKAKSRVTKKEQFELNQIKRHNLQILNKKNKRSRENWPQNQISKLASRI